MRKIFSLFVGLLFFATLAYAVEAVPDKPAKVEARHTPIAVVVEGTDSIGARLGMRLKEGFNRSNLFVLSEKNEPKIRLLVSSSPEFPSRPHIASVYSVNWVFTQSKDYLSFLLDKEHGTVSAEEVDGLVARLLERTDGISVKYANLLK